MSQLNWHSIYIKECLEYFSSNSQVGLFREEVELRQKKYGKNKLPEEKVVKMIKEAVDIEIEFCTASLPVSLIGMNENMMSQYIKFVADHLCGELDIKKIYQVENPFSWMTLISLQSKADHLSLQKFFGHTEHQ